MVVMHYFVMATHREKMGSVLHTRAWNVSDKMQCNVCMNKGCHILLSDDDNITKIVMSVLQRDCDSGTLEEVR